MIAVLVTVFVIGGIGLIAGSVETAISALWAAALVAKAGQGVRWLIRRCR